jgi:hypothetical protein
VIRKVRQVSSLIRGGRKGEALLSLAGLVNGVAAEDSIPGRDGRVNELLDQAVDLGVLLWMEIVDVAREAHGAVVLEGQVGREPLVGLRPIAVGNCCTVCIRLIFGNNFALARPLVDRIGEANNLVLDEPALGYYI